MSRRHIYLTAGAALLLTVVIVIAQVMGAGQPDVFDPLDPENAYWASLPTAATSIGRADAPVVVEEYFDYQCPHCHTAADVVVKPLIDEYVSNGTVRFVYRMFPILGPESVLAAQAAYCAVEQNAFWPFHERILSRKGMGNRGTYSAARLQQDAVASGLDEAAFAECFNGQTAKNFVQASHDRAVALGLRGTPTFFVNGQAVQASYAAIEAAIQRELSRIQ